MASGGSDATLSATIVGQAGGQLVATDGVTLTVGPSSLGGDHTLSVIASMAAVPEGVAASSAYYQFGPSGLTFAQPISISIPAPAGSTGNLSIYWTDGNGGFVELQTVRVGDTLTAQVSHFSGGFVSSSDQDLTAVTPPAEMEMSDDTMKDAMGDAGTGHVAEARCPEALTSACGCVDGIGPKECIVAATTQRCADATPVMCPDGTCAADRDSCPCPTGTSRCANNAKVCSPSEDACPCAAGTLRCNSGMCAAKDKCDCPSFAPTRCGDGHCAPSMDACNACPQGQMRCIDGSCAASHDACPCPSALPVRCESNKLCAANKEACNACEQGQFRCYDGTCKTAMNDCPCPDGATKCSNGFCAPNKDACPTACAQGLIGCPDKTCQSTFADCACPSRMPVKCPNGVCVADDKSCPTSSCSMGQLMCPDGSCANTREDCPCPQAASFKCGHGICAPSSEMCPKMTCPEGTFQCAEGACHASAIECACPIGAAYKCPSGACAPDINSCPTFHVGDALDGGMSMSCGGYMLPCCGGTKCGGIELTCGAGGLCVPSHDGGLSSVPGGGAQCGFPGLACCETNKCAQGFTCNAGHCEGNFVNPMDRNPDAGMFVDYNKSDGGQFFPPPDGMFFAPADGGGYPTCGFGGQACCDGSKCGPGFACRNNHCETDLQQTQPNSDGGFQGMILDGGYPMCGLPGQGCCNGQCAQGVTCVIDHCEYHAPDGGMTFAPADAAMQGAQQCGTLGAACCDHDTCASPGNICINHVCVVR